MGGELFLASIGGCFMSTLLSAIRARNAAVSDVRAEVIGTMAETPTRFSSVELHVEAQGNSEEIERLVAIADKGCIMMNTLRGVLDVGIRIGVPRFDRKINADPEPSCILNACRYPVRYQIPPFFEASRSLGLQV